MSMNIGLRSALAGLCALSAVATPAEGIAAAPQVRTQAAGWYRMMVGELEVTSLSDGTAPQPLDRQLRNTTLEAVAPMFARNHQAMPYEISINAFLVNTGSQLVLIDTGLGALLNGRAGGRLENNLRASGYSPDQVDAVLLTHLHVDHVNGLLLSSGKMAFPNAIIHLAEEELSFWLDTKAVETVPPEIRGLLPSVRAALQPYLAAGRVKTFKGPAEIVAGLRALPTPGHSPGHSVYMASSAGKSIMFIGDLVHAREVQFERPGVGFVYDGNLADAAAQRGSIFADAAETGSWVGAAHLSFPGFGHIRREADTYEWVPAPYSLKYLK